MYNPTHDALKQIAFVLTKCRVDSEPYVHNKSNGSDYSKVLEIMTEAFIELNKIVLIYMGENNNG